MNKNEISNQLPYALIEEKLGYTFRNKSLLEQAFTRSSYTAEHFEDSNNEVLEFIGDSVLGMLVVKCLSTRYQMEDDISLMKKHCPDVNLDELLNDKEYMCALDEAELSELKIALVKGTTLADAIGRLELAAYLRMSDGDIAGNVQEQVSVREDLFEAIVGAVAMDAAWDMGVLEALVDRMLDIDTRLAEGLTDEEDVLAALKKWFSTQKLEMVFKEMPSPCSLLPYARSVNLGERMLSYCSCGYGKSVQEAKRMAARQALQFIKKVQKRAKDVLQAIGAPSPERAVNQLQELWQKKVIAEPIYHFRQRGLSSTGNPEWECTCEIEGVSDGGWGAVCASKAEAKKQIAFDMLCSIMGLDVPGIFMAYGEMSEIISEEEV